MKRGDDEAYGDQPHLVERIIERNGNGFGRLKDIVFSAVILAAGGVIWAQQSKLNQIETDVAILKLKCTEQPLMRGGP